MTDTTAIVVPVPWDVCCYDIYIEQEHMKEMEVQEALAKEQREEDNYDALWDMYIEEMRDIDDIPIRVIVEDTAMRRVRLDNRWDNDKSEFWF